jgi:hypothetical protein
MRSMFPLAKGPLSRIPRSGPAPVMMRAREWLKVVPEWERLTTYIENNEEAKGKLGWVREMYAFSIAAALQVRSAAGVSIPATCNQLTFPADTSVGKGSIHVPQVLKSAFIVGMSWALRQAAMRLHSHISAAKLYWLHASYACIVQEVELDVQMPPSSPLMVQPPADHKLGEAAMCHYTWGSIFKDTLQNNTEVWKFDKRFYTSKEVALQVRSDRPWGCIVHSFCLH